MSMRSFRNIKHSLDAMFIPVWKDTPVGYECNPKTWDEVDKILGSRRMTYFHIPTSAYLAKSFIHVRDDVADGFHPVYEFPDKNTVGKLHLIKKLGKNFEY
jgi:hypothetical protein